jgi:hypothetical protein
MEAFGTYVEFKKIIVTKKDFMPYITKVATASGAWFVFGILK